MSEFAQAIEQEIPGLRRYARALTRDPERADDLVQNCLTRALAKEHLWQPGTDLRAWLFTILHHARVNDLRRSAHEETRNGVAMRLMRAAPDQPDARLELRDLERAIARLPEYQRRALLLVGLEGMSYGQVAAIFGVPTGTVRSRLARARETLRAELSRAPADADRPMRRRAEPAAASA